MKINFLSFYSIIPGGFERRACACVCVAWCCLLIHLGLYTCGFDFLMNFFWFVSFFFGWLFGDGEGKGREGKYTNVVSRLYAVLYRDRAHRCGTANGVHACEAQSHEQRFVDTYNHSSSHYFACPNSYWPSREFPAAARPLKTRQIVP